MNTIEYTECAPLSNCLGISHGFFTRRGGVSGGEFASLNCGQYSGDNPEHVSINRQHVTRILGGRWMVSLKQTHSNTVHEIDPHWNADQVPSGDGMVTTVPGVVLGALGADCAAVLLADPVNKVIGAAHAGWKGAVSGITDSVVDKMQLLGAEISQMVVSIGPCIQLKSYQVGADFVAQVEKLSSIPCEPYFSCGDTEDDLYFDLPGYIEEKLKVKGLSSIHRINEDTYSNEGKYFSYRRSCHQKQQNYGRQVGAICLNG